jgi:hypothetical protein
MKNKRKDRKGESSKEKNKTTKEEWKNGGQRKNKNKKRNEKISFFITSCSKVSKYFYSIH